MYHKVWGKYAKILQSDELQPRVHQSTVLWRPATSMSWHSGLNDMIFIFAFHKIESILQRRIKIFFLLSDLFSLHTVVVV
jgi:hypothetical protein